MNAFDRIAMAFYIIAGIFFALWGVEQTVGVFKLINAWSDLLAYLCAFVFWGMAYLQHIENKSREKQRFNSRLYYVDRF